MSGSPSPIRAQFLFAFSRYEGAEIHRRVDLLVRLVGGQHLDRSVGRLPLTFCQLAPPSVDVHTLAALSPSR